MDKLKNVDNIITDYLREQDYFNPEILFKYWENIISVEGNINTKHGINTNLNNLIYFLIRLIVNTDKKNLNINYLNLNVSKSIINKTEMTNLNNSIEYNMGIINKYKNKIKDKLQGQTINIEFYYLINNLLVNKENVKFNNLHVVLENKKLFNKFNTIHTNKQTVLKATTINKYYTELYNLL